MATCATCNDAEISCEACGGQASAGALMSTAGCRGEYWATSVARQVSTERDWPPFEGKARTIALGKVHDLGGDEATQERRPLWFWRWAEY